MSVTTLRSIICILLLCSFSSITHASVSSTNVPLDSPIYFYIEKLAGFGLISSDIKGIRPFSKSEVVRLVKEAQGNLQQASGTRDTTLAKQILKNLKDLFPRELAFSEEKNRKAKPFDITPLSSARMRYVYLYGKPRSYDRKVHDPGNDGVFGIGQGLRPANPYPTPVQHHGSEGTPLSENNEGTIYRNGHSLELRLAGEAYLGQYAAAMIEPQLLVSTEGQGADVTINRGYLKIGGGAAELEVGRDASWLGLGYRGAITLSNNSRNLDLVKISSPEPFQSDWFSFLGKMKYSVIISQLDETVTNGVKRQPWFYALKFSTKPTENLEIGGNLGRQVGGPGVENGFGSIMRGVIGGTNSDNSNSLAGLELRYRIPYLNNTELFAEFSGEDTASFWPIVESYQAGIFIPCLTSACRDDLRFEYFRGNNILYTNSTFPGGYIYKGLPLGHAQGGAVDDYFLRYTHWFTGNNFVSLDYSYTQRGGFGLLPGQAAESKHAGRIAWTKPLNSLMDLQMRYGIERIHNVDLVSGTDRTNQLVIMEMRYQY